MPGDNLPALPRLPRIISRTEFNEQLEQLSTAQEPTGTVIKQLQATTGKALHDYGAQRAEYQKAKEHYEDKLGAFHQSPSPESAWDVEKALRNACAEHRKARSTFAATNMEKRYTDARAAGFKQVDPVHLRLKQLMKNPEHPIGKIHQEIEQARSTIDSQAEAIQSIETDLRRHSRQTDVALSQTERDNASLPLHEIAQPPDNSFRIPPLSEWLAQTGGAGRKRSAEMQSIDEAVGIHSEKRLAYGDELQKMIDCLEKNAPNAEKLIRHELLQATHRELMEAGGTLLGAVNTWLRGSHGRTNTNAATVLRFGLTKEELQLRKAGNHFQAMDVQFAKARAGVISNSMAGLESIKPLQTTPTPQRRARDTSAPSSPSMAPQPQAPQRRPDHPLEQSSTTPSTSAGVARAATEKKRRGPGF